MNESLGDLAGFGRFYHRQRQKQRRPMRARGPVCQRCQFDAKCCLPIIGADPAICEGLKNLSAGKRGHRLVQCIDFVPEVEQYRQVKKGLFRSQRSGRPGERGIMLQLWHPEEKDVVYLPVLESHGTSDAAHVLKHRGLAWSWG